MATHRATGLSSRAPSVPESDGGEKDLSRVDAPESVAGKQAEFRREALPHMDPVYGFALRLAGSESEADDLVQETYLRAWRAWDQYTLGTNCKSWLFTICRNLFVRTRQRSKRHDELLRENAPSDEAFPLRREPVFMGSETGNPESTFFEGIVDDTILEAIDELPREYRVAVHLSDLEGLRYDEVAEVLDVPVGTVKSRLHRGRRILQKKLYDYAVSIGFLDSGERQQEKPPERDVEDSERSPGECSLSPPFGRSLAPA